MTWRHRAASEVTAPCYFTYWWVFWSPRRTHLRKHGEARAHTRPRSRGPRRAGRNRGPRGTPRWKRGERALKHRHQRQRKCFFNFSNSWVNVRFWCLVGPRLFTKVMRAFIGNKWGGRMDINEPLDFVSPGACPNVIGSWVRGNNYMEVGW